MSNLKGTFQTQYYQVYLDVKFS